MAKSRDELIADLHTAYHEQAELLNGIGAAIRALGGHIQGEKVLSKSTQSMLNYWASPKGLARRAKTHDPIHDQTHNGSHTDPS